MTPSQVRRDIEQWKPVAQWLESRLQKPLTRRDWLRPAKPTPRKRKGMLITAAAATLGALAISTWFLHASQRASVDPVPAPTSTTVALGATPVRPTERVVESPPPADGYRGEELRERWQLTGVVRASDANVIVLSDRKDERTVHLDANDEFDGWAVQDSGTNYAVLVRGDDVVRLTLNQESTR